MLAREHAHCRHKWCSALVLAKAATIFLNPNSTNTVIFRDEPFRQWFSLHSRRAIDSGRQRRPASRRIGFHVITA